jgi:hypothetical protein
MDGVNRPMTVKFVDVCRWGNYQREINSPEEPELPQIYWMKSVSSSLAENCFL